MAAPLFRPPGSELAADLDRALAAAARAFAVPAGRMGDLPRAVRDLSLLLTAERGGLARPYWAAPRYVAAYLRYFLPWNLYRLAWLLPGLDLPLASGDRILDLGSGPLTLPLALWLARPESRALELEVICADVSPKIMERGRDIFHALAGKDSPWRITLLRATAGKAPRLAPGASVRLALAGNVLNEMAERQSRGGEGPAQRLAAFTRSLAACLAPGGRALLMEPGSRLGGSLISLCREAALGQGFTPLAPCTHAARCPLAPASLPAPGGASALAGARGGDSEPGGRTGQERLYGRGNSWCHFRLPAEGAPASLAALSADAGLEKDSMSLSFLLLKAPERNGAPGVSGASPDGELDELEALYAALLEEDRNSGPEPGFRKDAAARRAEAVAGRGVDAAGQTPDASRQTPSGAVVRGAQPARVVSGPIVLPGKQPGRYVCGAFGLGLLPDAGNLPPGAGLDVTAGADGRDAKSGALLVRSAERKAGQKAAGNRTAPRESERPDRSDPGHGKPARGKPDHGKPTRGKPGHDKPGSGKPAHGKPEADKPAHGKPSPGRPEPGKSGGPGKSGSGKSGPGGPKADRAGKRQSENSGRVKRTGRKGQRG